MLLPKMPDSELQPQSRAAQPWPHSDPCQGRSFSFARFVLMAALFLCMTVGSLPLFFLLMKRPYGLQAASMIVYTIFAVFFTFARTGTRTGKDLPPYMFTCPAVQPQFPRLLGRHLGFVVVLFALQTAALAARPNLPDWWNVGDRKGVTPFDLALILLCFGLGYAQVFTNRSLLDRAHRGFPAETAGNRLSP
jgi:Ca2+/Na+ antiporter